MGAEPKAAAGANPEAEKYAACGARGPLQYWFNRWRNQRAEKLPFPRVVLARLRQRKFTHIHSLGVNCEPAFRFYRKWRFLDSSLLAWANCRTLEYLTNALENLPRLLTGAAEYDDVSRMWVCAHTRVSFHGKLHLAPDAHPGEAALAADLADLRGRVEHLKAKFLASLAEGGDVLFVHRLREVDMEAEDLGLRLDRLQRALERLGAKDYTLLVICERRYLGRMPAAPRRLFRAVRVFNPDASVVDKDLGDAVGWRAIFTEFAPARILPKAHKFKFE